MKKTLTGKDNRTDYKNIANRFSKKNKKKFHCDSNDMNNYNIDNKKSFFY